MVPSLEKGSEVWELKGKMKGVLGGEEIDCVCGQVPQGTI